MEDTLKTKKKAPIKYILSVLFLVTLIVVTIIVLCTQYDMKQVYNVVKMIRYRYIFAGMSLMFIYIFFEGLATRKILMTMDCRTSIINNFSYAAIDYYFSAVTPSATGGQPMAGYYMTKDDIPVTKTSISLLINTCLFKFVLLILSLVVFIGGFITGRNYVTSRPLVLVLFVLGFFINILFIIGLLLIVFKRNWVEAIGLRLLLLARKLKIIKKNKFKIIRKFKIKMDEYEAAAHIMITHRWKFFFATLYNFIQRIAYFSMAYFVFLAFREVYPELNNMTYFDLISIQIIIALSVDSLPLPGGVGISEFLYIFLYGQIYVTAVAGIYDTEAIVASAMLFTRAISFYLPVIITCLIFIIKHVLTMRKSIKRAHESELLIENKEKDGNIDNSVIIDNESIKTENIIEKPKDEEDSSKEMIK